MGVRIYYVRIMFYYMGTLKHSKSTERERVAHMGFLTNEQIKHMQTFRKIVKEATANDLLALREYLKDKKERIERVAYIIVELELDDRGVIRYNEETDEYELA